MLSFKLLTAGALSAAIAAPAFADEHIVIVTGFSYFPAITYADPGDTVRFVNQSGGTETVVGRDTGWIIGPLNDLEEGALVVNEETELAFFSAYQDCAGGSDCGADNGSPDAQDETGDEDPYGTYEEATIKAEISFEDPVLEADNDD